MAGDGSSPLRPSVLTAVILALVCLLSINVRTQESNPKLAGLVQDWSTGHAIFVRDGSVASVAAIQRDPRALMAWQVAQITRGRAERALRHETPLASDDNGLRFRRDRWFPSAQNETPDTDWSVNLTVSTATGATAPGMSPAKFSFDIGANPSCAGDFAVFPVNQTPVAGSAENLMAFNNLYSGTAPSQCNMTAPTVMWSYAIAGGAVVTSPALSFDGTKVAFVETSGGAAHFYVLAWKSGDGVTVGSLQSPFKPVSGTLVTKAPVAGSGTYTDLPFGPASDTVTLSSPYIDYVNDAAYVGDDKGNLFRIVNVFCTVNALCAGGSPPEPAIDRTFGGGSVTVGATSCSGTANSKLTGPISDSEGTGDVFVGCADGKLYGFNASGTALSGSPVIVGNGTANGGIIDAPVVDTVSGFVYAFSGDNGTGPVAVQVKFTGSALSGARTANLGKTTTHTIYAGNFNDAYFSSGTSANWLLYAQGYNAAGNQTVLYGVGFAANRNMNTGTPANMVNFITGLGGHADTQCSPLTEFLNGTDQLFLGCVVTNDAYAFGINAFPAAATATHAAQGGTSAIIVDNSGSSVMFPQASSIYFTNLASTGCTSGGTGFCAVKLTQSALQ